MAKIVLGVGTSHSPMLAVPGNLWADYARGDVRNRELVYPPEGVVLSYEEGVKRVAVAEKEMAPETFQAEYDRCQAAIDQLRRTFDEVEPDVTVIVADDQDELFYDDNMPAFSIYWGESIPIVPFFMGSAPADSPVAKAIVWGYGDAEMDVPVASRLGRHLIDHLIDHDFDVAHFRYLRESYGGKVGRRYPTPDGETDYDAVRSEHRQGLPHGFSFVVKRLFDSRPRTILPVFQNTCYPPNQPTPSRCYRFGQELRRAIESWDSPSSSSGQALRVAVVGSGGLSHFVVDEELDRTVLRALKEKDAETLSTLPRRRLNSAASEIRNWVTLAGAVEHLDCEIIDYVPVRRTPAETGGGWAFARWK